MEDKKYEIVGKVEIGTDEYRDLIEDRMRAEKESEEYRKNYWKEQEKTKELEKKVKSLEEAIEHYRKFVNSDLERNNAYKLFLVAIQEEKID